MEGHCWRGSNEGDHYEICEFVAAFDVGVKSGDGGYGVVPLGVC